MDSCNDIRGGSGSGLGQQVMARECLDVEPKRFQQRIGEGEKITTRPLNGQLQIWMCKKLVCAHCQSILNGSARRADGQPLPLVADNGNGSAEFKSRWLPCASHYF
jgi:hypothetical protein